MIQHRPDEQLYSREFVEQNFETLKLAALQDLTSYVCGWSVYTMKFLNSVAELQGVPERISDDAVLILRTGCKQIRDPRLASLIRKAKSPHSMDIGSVIVLISSKVEARRSNQIGEHQLDGSEQAP